MSQTHFGQLRCQHHDPKRLLYISLGPGLPSEVLSIPQSGELPVCHVLIIEDEAIIALDLESLLEHQGATSFSFAASEDEAVALANEHRPGIITSDVTLLQGTGPAAVARIRLAMGQIPVVFISGTAPDCCADDPLTRIIRKPLDRPAVAAAFREFHHLSCA